MSDRKQCNRCERNLAQKGRNLCRACTGKGRLPSGKYAYRKHRKDYCEDCGVMPEHKCVLDVDHLDGDHSNNDLSNLYTRCANCHRIKTCESEDSRNIKYRSIVLTKT